MLEDDQWRRRSSLGYLSPVEFERRNQQLLAAYPGCPPTRGKFSHSTMLREKNPQVLLELIGRDHAMLAGREAAKMKNASNEILIAFFRSFEIGWPKCS